MKKILITLIGFAALALVTQAAWGYGFGTVYQLNPEGVAHLNNWVETCLVNGDTVGGVDSATTADTHSTPPQETTGEMSGNKSAEQAGFTCGTGRFWGAVIPSG